MADLSEIYSTGNSLNVSIDGHFYNQENIIYNKIISAYLEKSMNGHSPSSVFDEELLNSIFNYSITGNKYTGVFINDFVNNIELMPVDLHKIEKYSSSNREILYNAFIDFIIFSYGKKVLSQSIKDAYYYHNIFKAISSITGDSIDEIDKKFNKYLAGYRTGSHEIPEKKKYVDTGDDEFRNVSYSLLKDNVAVLQRNKDDYRILIKKSTGDRTIKLKHNDKGSTFNNILYMNINNIVVSEIIESGTIIYLYNTDSDRIMNKFILPYLYLNSIGFSDESYLIFSAACGQYSDISILNIVTGEWNNITEAGMYYYPVKIKNKIFCISVTDKYSIIEISKITGEKRTIFSTNQKISDINIINENYLIFSMEINGLSNIYSFNLQSENLAQITNDKSNNHFPVFSNDNIYFFSYYKSKYRIFSTGYYDSK